MGFLWSFFWTGAAGDGWMGLSAQLDPSEVRGLVLLLFCPVTVLVAANCTKFLMNDKSFSFRNHDVVTA